MKKVKLNDVCKLVTDGTHDTPKTIDNGYPLIKAKEIVTGKIDFSSCDYISKEDHKKVISRSKPEKGDILFTHIGASLGAAALIKTNRQFSIKNIALFKPNPDIIYNKYLYYIVIHKMFQDFIKNKRGGAAQPFVGLGTLRNHEIEYNPVLVEQKKIATILSNYDDLIDNNTKRIQILEQMAKIVYDEWFVKFRFPGHENVKMVDSELGKIPKGWEVKNLGEICDFTMGQSPKSRFYNDIGEGLPFHQGVTDFGSRFPERNTYCTVDKRIAKKGDILFSVRAPVGRLNIADTKLILGRGLASIRHKKSLQSFLFYQLKHIFFDEDTIGGGTIFNAVTKDDVYDIKLLIPNDTNDVKFDNTVSSIDLIIQNLERKSMNLIKTRDLLLPKLINGEINVSNLDIKVPMEKT